MAIGPTAQILRTLTPNGLPALAEGEFGLDMGSSPAALWIGVPSGVSVAGKILLALEGGGATGGAVTSVSPPISPAPGQFWWDANAGNLFLWYNDGTSSQWVPAVPVDPPGAGGGGAVGGPFLPLSGGLMTGPIDIQTSGLTGDSYLEFTASRGTVPAPQALQQGDPIGGVYGGGYDGTAWSDGGETAMNILAAGNWAPGSHPTAIAFGTTPTGSIHAQPRMRIQQGVSVGAGLADMGAGTVNATGYYVNGVPLGTGGGAGTITGVTAGAGLTGGGSTGNVTLSIANNANLPGAPTAATAPAGTSTTQIATTAYVENALGAGGFGTITGITTAPGSGLTGGATSGNVTLALDANIGLTGTPTAPTAAPGTNTTQIATTAYVRTAITGLGAGTVTSITAGTGLTGGTIINSGTIALDTNLNLTGTPTATTAPAGNNSTRVATTAYVDAAVGAANGTVTSVTAGTGLVTTPSTGIVATGSISLGTVGTAGSFTNADITVDAHGRVTSATSGSAGGGGSSSALTTDTGKFYVNFNSAPTFPSSGAVTHITGADIGADASTALVIDAVGTSTLRLRKLMGSVTQTTAGTAPLPGNNVQLGLLEIQGYNNVGISKMGNAAQIRFVSSGAWTGTNQGTSVQFFTVRNNETSLRSAMFITGTGGIVVGGAPDEGAGSVSAEHVWAAGEDLRQLIADLDARITALGG